LTIEMIRASAPVHVSTALPVSNLATPTRHGLGGALRPSTVAKVIDDRPNVSTSSANRLAEHLAALAHRATYQPP
jgi:hypothetical protein